MSESGQAETVETFAARIAREIGVHPDSARNAIRDEVRRGRIAVVKATSPA
jgi:hypothetical protein